MEAGLMKEVWCLNRSWAVISGYIGLWYNWSIGGIVRIPFETR